MTRSLSPLAAGLLMIMVFAAPSFPDNPNVLLGTWKGKATGPAGGPPTGEITVTFEREKSRTIGGVIEVKGTEDIQYSGRLENVRLENGNLSALAVFKLGENPLEAKITGPLKGDTIEGTFTATMNGQKIGEGTFKITKSKKA